MSWQHPGQGIPEMTREEHDGDLNAKRVSFVSGATIFAVVNTSAGNVTAQIPSGVTVFQGSQPWNSLGTVTLNGLPTLSPSPNYIGLVSVLGKVELAGNATLSDSKTYIGLTTTTLGVGSSFIGLASIQGNVNVNGNVTLSDAKTYIGLTTTTLGVGDKYIGLASVNIGGSLPAGANYIGLMSISHAAWSNPNTFIGLVTAVPGGNVTLNASAAFIGIATVIQASSTRSLLGNVTLSDAKTYIGLTTSTLGLGDRFIGLATVVNAGNVTLNASAAFIGLATVVIGNASVATKNAGTTKTLKVLPIRLSTNSNASIAITNTFYITHILLNSNATVRLNILSGVTYLTGNVSLGINIFPGGGWVENGSPDSPLYIGQAAAAAINFEKADAGGIISQVSGKVVYFDE